MYLALIVEIRILFTLIIKVKNKILILQNQKIMIIVIILIIRAIEKTFSTLFLIY